MFCTRAVFKSTNRNSTVFDIVRNLCKIMIFARYKDGKTYPAREMLDALEHGQEINRESFCAFLSENVSNNTQI